MIGTEAATGQTKFLVGYPQLFADWRAWSGSVIKLDSTQINVSYPSGAV